MSKTELFKRCEIDVKQLYKNLIFGSKKERVNHFPKPYTRSGKSPYPVDRIIGNYAKKICRNEGFFENYKRYILIRDLIDIIRRFFNDND
ncbi:MAG: hypothetical protein ACTSRH_07555 [Promethearchaeota archaeon]